MLIICIIVVACILLKTDTFITASSSLAATCKATTQVRPTPTSKLYICELNNYSINLKSFHAGSLSDPSADVSRFKFMETVASKIPDKWKRVGVSLGIGQSQLNAISMHRLADPLECFGDVYTCWESNPQSPTNWGTLVTVLRSNYVGEKELGDTIEGMSALAHQYGVEFRCFTFCTQSGFGESWLKPGLANPHAYVS